MRTDGKLGKENGVEISINFKVQILSTEKTQLSGKNKMKLFKFETDLPSTCSLNLTSVRGSLDT